MSKAQADLLAAIGKRQILTGRLNALESREKRTDSETVEYEQLQVEERASTASMAAMQAAVDAEQKAGETIESTGSSEQRERLELRDKAHGEGLLTSQLSGQRPDGARAEYLAAHGCGDRTIPFDYWTKPPLETRALTPPPATGSGVNLEPIQPHVFADGLAAMLGVTLKMVDSGQFSTATITTALLATAKAKSAAADATAGVLTATTSGVKRISASVTMAEEDIASVGQANYESALMAHVGLALQNGHDTYALTGTGSAPAPKGLLLAIGAVAARSTEETFASYAAVPADAVDGIFAREMNDVFILCGVNSFVHAAKIIQSGTAVSASAYLRAEAGGFMATSRFPAPASNVQQALAYRRGRPGVQTAVQPIWNRITIDDRFTLGANAERKVSLHVLLGDVIVQQASAYKRIAFKLG